MRQIELNPEAKGVLLSARSVAKTKGSPHVDLWHILVAIFVRYRADIHTPDGRALMKLEIGAETIYRKALAQIPQQDRTQVPVDAIPFNSATEGVIAAARDEASLLEAPQVTPIHLLLALLSAIWHPAVQMLNNSGLTLENFEKALKEHK